MPFDLRQIAEAQKKILVLVGNHDTRLILEQFLESSSPLVEAAVRDALQELVIDINAQLAPQVRLRMVQEGTYLIPDVVSLGEQIVGSSRRMEGDTVAKVLVRMPTSIKLMANDAAQQAGVSLNNWTVTMLERALTNIRERQPKARQPENPAWDDKSPPSLPQPGRDEHE